MMAQKVDLYSILCSYVNKHNSPYIDVGVFLLFLERYAKKIAGNQPEWDKWTQDVQPKFYSELAALAEDGKCELIPDDSDGRIYMSHFYLDALRQWYRDVDGNADQPFPGPGFSGQKIPENQIRFLEIEPDVAAYLAEPEGDTPPIVQINLPETYGSVLVPSEFVPGQLMEAALLKVRHYLRNRDNKEYALHKLTPQLMGKEKHLTDLLNQILFRPLDCYNTIKEGGEFPYLFWAHFCMLVKGDIRKKNEHLNDDIAAVQAVYVIEAVNGYYRALEVKRREKEFAFKELELHLGKPPYSYTTNQIVTFTNAKGGLLLDRYSRGELEEWLRKRTTETRGAELPALLVFAGRNDEQRFVSKSKIVPLCIRLLGEAREKVKNAVSKQWFGLLKEYTSDTSMENDRDFEKFLAVYTGKLCPALTLLLEDPKLPLVYEEFEQSETAIPAAARMFGKGVPLPYSALFSLNRKDLLADIKLLLPFWYSVPVITVIIRFFRSLTRGRRAAKRSAGNPPGNGENEAPRANGRNSPGEILNAAREIEFLLVPPGAALETHLRELENRWIRLINKQARANLAEDVNALVRDKLRQTLRTRKRYRITRENLALLAENIVNRTPSLQTLNGKDSLKSYIELYLVKLLQTIKYPVVSG
jgi:hypothetical protein